MVWRTVYESTPGSLVLVVSDCSHVSKLRGVAAAEARLKLTRFVSHFALLVPLLTRYRKRLV